MTQKPICLLFCPAIPLLIAGCQGPGPTGSAKEWPTPQPKVFHCHRATGPITIDGKIDEAAWSGAHVITRLHQPESLQPPTTKTEIRLLWDDTHLYLSGKIQDKDVVATQFGHDVKCWHDDVLELFVKPSADRHPYYELHVNPNGATLDLMFPRRGAGEWLRFVRYQSGMRAAATIQGTVNNWKDEDEGWTGEMAVPLKALALDGKPPKPGDTWRFAVCKYNYSVHLPPGEIGDGALEYGSTARLPKVSYHLHEYYDILRFEAAK